MTSPAQPPTVVIEADELVAFDDTLPEDAWIVPTSRAQQLFVLYTELVMAPVKNSSLLVHS
jgi:hypothetical protein